jgi:uncharacterized protein (TIGR03086 family)
MRIAGDRSRLAGMTELSTDELIALGRDREAVEAALRGTRCEAGDASAPGGEAMSEAGDVQQLEEVVALLRQVVAGLTPAEYGDPTPCTAFTVGDVLEHMIAGATTFAPAFRGGPSPHPVPTEGDTLVRWDTAMTELLEAVRTEGAMERTIASPFGDQPGSAFVRYVAFDGLVHAWDLARASGQELEARDELVAEVDGYAHGLLVPEMRDGDTFAVATEPPAGASSLDRLAAFSGRVVA